MPVFKKRNASVVTVTEIQEGNTPKCLKWLI